MGIFFFFEERLLSLLLLGIIFVSFVIDFKFGSVSRHFIEGCLNYNSWESIN